MSRHQKFWSILCKSSWWVATILAKWKSCGAQFVACVLMFSSSRYVRLSPSPKHFSMYSVRLVFIFPTFPREHELPNQRHEDVTSDDICLRSEVYLCRLSMSSSAIQSHPSTGMRVPYFTLQLLLESLVICISNITLQYLSTVDFKLFHLSRLTIVNTSFSLCDHLWSIKEYFFLGSFACKHPLQVHWSFQLLNCLSVTRE